MIPQIFVSGLQEMSSYRGDVTHVISLVDKDDVGYVSDLGLPPARRLLLVCDDVDSEAEARERMIAMPGSRCIAPTRRMVRRALRFASALTAPDKLMIQCGHGISRSPAIAFGVLCQAQPNVPESDVFRRLLALTPHATPNRLIVSHADGLLRRKGRMITAIESIQIQKRDK